MEQFTDIFKEKQASALRLGYLEQNVQDFVGYFLRTRFGVVMSITVDWGYNVLESLALHHTNHNSFHHGLLFMLLSGALPEEVYWQDLHLQKQVTLLFVYLEVLRSILFPSGLAHLANTTITLPSTTPDASTSFAAPDSSPTVVSLGEGRGLPKCLIMYTLQRFFPQKSNVQLTALYNALEATIDGTASGLSGSGSGGLNNILTGMNFGSTSISLGGSISVNSNPLSGASMTGNNVSSNNTNNPNSGNSTNRSGSSSNSTHSIGGNDTSGNTTTNSSSNSSNDNDRSPSSQEKHDFSVLFPSRDTSSFAESHFMTVVRQQHLTECEGFLPGLRNYVVASAHPAALAAAHQQSTYANTTSHLNMTPIGTSTPPQPSSPTKTPAPSTSSSSLPSVPVDVALTSTSSQPGANNTNSGDKVSQKDDSGITQTTLPPVTLTTSSSTSSSSSSFSFPSSSFSSTPLPRPLPSLLPSLQFGTTDGVVLQLAEIRRRWLEYDPLVTPKGVTEYLAKALRCAPEEVDGSRLVDVDYLMQCLWNTSFVGPTLPYDSTAIDTVAGWVKRAVLMLQGPQPHSLQTVANLLQVPLTSLARAGMEPNPCIVGGFIDRHNNASPSSLPSSSFGGHSSSRTGGNADQTLTILQATRARAMYNTPGLITVNSNINYLLSGGLGPLPADLDSADSTEGHEEPFALGLPSKLAQAQQQEQHQQPTSMFGFSSPLGSTSSSSSTSSMVSPPESISLSHFALSMTSSSSSTNLPTPDFQPEKRSMLTKLSSLIMRTRTRFGLPSNSKDDDSLCFPRGPQYTPPVLIKLIWPNVSGSSTTGSVSMGIVPPLNASSVSTHGTTSGLSTPISTARDRERQRESTIVVSTPNHQNNSLNATPILTSRIIE